MRDFFMGGDARRCTSDLGQVLIRAL